MAIKKSYRLVTDGFLQLGASYYEGPAIALDSCDDALNLYVTIGGFDGLGDVFCVLQTSPDGLDFAGTLLISSTISAQGAYYVVPTALYKRPDSYIRLFIGVSVAPVELSSINAWARVGTVRNRGRYGR